jgi:hypothetical protein
MDVGETGMHFALVIGERVKVTPFARASQGAPGRLRQSDEKRGIFDLS